MKYKMQDKQNQLIERISDQHLVIGVDIAQQFHVARAVNYRGLVIGKPITFENDEIGFTKFLSWMNELKGSQGRSEEHTSELQSRGHLVCRLLLEKKNIKVKTEKHEGLTE